MITSGDNVTEPPHRRGDSTSSTDRSRSIRLARAGNPQQVVVPSAWNQPGKALVFGRRGAGVAVTAHHQYVRAVSTTAAGAQNHKSGLPVNSRDSQPQWC